MAAVLSEGVLDQNGPKWSKWPYSELNFSIRETKMDQNGPFWPEEVHFGPFRSTNRTLAIPECWPERITSRDGCFLLLVPSLGQFYQILDIQCSPVRRSQGVRASEDRDSKKNTRRSDTKSDTKTHKVKTFISCYRTPDPGRVPEGVFEGVFEGVSERF